MVLAFKILGNWLSSKAQQDTDMQFDDYKSTFGVPMDV
jgi:hypothetical protein